MALCTSAGGRLGGGIPPTLLGLSVPLEILSRVPDGCLPPPPTPRPQENKLLIRVSPLRWCHSLLSPPRPILRSKCRKLAWGTAGVTEVAQGLAVRVKTTAVSHWQTEEVPTMGAPDLPPLLSPSSERRPGVWLSGAWRQMSENCGGGEAG